VHSHRSAPNILSIKHFQRRCWW